MIAHLQHGALRRAADPSQETARQMHDAADDHARLNRHGRSASTRQTSTVARHRAWRRHAVVPQRSALFIDDGIGCTSPSTAAACPMAASARRCSRPLPIATSRDRTPTPARSEEGDGICQGDFRQLCDGARFAVQLHRCHRVDRPGEGGDERGWHHLHPAADQRQRHAQALWRAIGPWLWREGAAMTASAPRLWTARYNSFRPTRSRPSS